MKPDAALLKEIMDHVANVGYSREEIGIENLGIEDVPTDKLNYHVVHLIEEGYLRGKIKTFPDGYKSILIERMTDKGALLLETTENPRFLEWVKSNTGSAFGDLLQGGVQGSAALAWGLAKQWLAENGVKL